MSAYKAALEAAIVAFDDAASILHDKAHIVQPLLDVYKKHGETIVNARASQATPAPPAHGETVFLKGHFNDMAEAGWRTDPATGKVVGPDAHAGEGAEPSTLAAIHTTTPSVSGRGQPAPAQVGEWQREAAAEIANYAEDELLEAESLSNPRIAAIIAKHAPSAPAPDKLVEALEDARSAIASLDPMALGGQHANHPEDQEYYVRDELLWHIDAALSAHRSGGKTGGENG